MTEPRPVLKDTLLSSLPSPWPDLSLREKTAHRRQGADRCIVALDDDPTGTQTMHDIWVVTRWEVEDLRKALRSGEPSIYVLTNSRSVSLAKAQAINRTVATNLVAAANAEGRTVTVVSRSDSTLRGHYPGEVDALAQAMIDAGHPSFDGLCIVPFFPEGGRYTVDDIHWVQEGNQLIPAAQTPYAQDAVFGYQHSALPEWVEEKTSGRVKATEVITISLELIRSGGPDAVAALLRTLEPGSVIIVNAADYADLDVFVMGLMQAEDEGRHYLFRTAASFVKVAAGLPDRPLLIAEELTGDRPPGGGLIVFGSYVPKSTRQFEALQALPGLDSVELSVRAVLDSGTRQEAIAQTAKQLNRTLTEGHDALVYTSRELVTLEDEERNLTAGQIISDALMETVRRIPCTPRYVIGKGGITSSDLATSAMNIRMARVRGQIYPGVPVWQPGEESRWPGVPYVIFPGNVGQDDTVAVVVSALREA